MLHSKEAVEVNGDVNGCFFNNLHTLHLHRMATSSQLKHTLESNEPREVTWPRNPLYLDALLLLQVFFSHSPFLL
jgi:hypothetical protein